MKIGQLLLLESIKTSSSKLIVHAIVSVPYFYSTQIRISLIIWLGMNDSVCHLGKLKLVDLLNGCH